MTGTVFVHASTQGIYRLGQVDGSFPALIQKLFVYDCWWGVKCRNTRNPLFLAAP
jgi:hypothetical protein